MQVLKIELKNLYLWLYIFWTLYLFHLQMKKQNVRESRSSCIFYNKQGAKCVTCQQQQVKRQVIEDIGILIK